MNAIRTLWAALTNLATNVQSLADTVAAKGSGAGVAAEPTSTAHGAQVAGRQAGAHSVSRGLETAGPRFVGRLLGNVPGSPRGPTWSQRRAFWRDGPSLGYVDRQLGAVLVPE
jgi:hypothetical protein